MSQPLTSKAAEIRIQILKMISKSNASHIGSCFSTVELLTFLYFDFLNIDPTEPEKEDRDRFILSKGHAAAALYATLASRGFFPEENLNKYCCDNAILSGHATHKGNSGVEISTGSLGHGLPFGMGMALESKLGNKNFRVVTLLSDGECQEGSNWEAFLMAPQLKLDNLIVIMDNNKIQGYGDTSKINDLSSISTSLEKFGWTVCNINGHELHEIHEAFHSVEKDRPLFINANTIKGKGVTYMEDSLDWHYKCPQDELFEQALNELEKSL